MLKNYGKLADNVYIEILEVVVMAEVLTEDLLHKKTPQQLTTLLFQECLDRLNQAIAAIHAKRYIESNQLLQKCNDILYRLGAGLNYEAGIIADELEALYDYMALKLIEANLTKKTEPIMEVKQILYQILDAWMVALEKNEDPSASTLHRKKTSAYDAFYNE